MGIYLDRFEFKGEVPGEAAIRAHLKASLGSLECIESVSVQGHTVELLCTMNREPHQAAQAAMLALGGLGVRVSQPGGESSASTITRQGGGLHVRRVAPAQPAAWQAAGRCQAGAARVDLTPDPGLDTAGYSAMATVGRGTLGRLYARALYLEDAAGVSACFCYLDLMSASRYLYEAVAAATASIGIGTENLILAGSHTHNGPGHFYGNSLYDMVTGHLSGGFDEPLAQWLVARIAAAVRGAFEVRAPARVGVGRARLFGPSRQAELWCFEANHGAARWNQAGAPGEGAPEGLDPEALAVDPRVSVVAAEHLDGRPMAAFASYALHATAVGDSFERYSPDWPGFAAREVRRQLGAQTIVGYAGGASADTTPMRAEDIPPRGQTLAARLGGQVGAAIAEAYRSAERSEHWRLEIRAHDWNPAQREVLLEGERQARTLLPERWNLGEPALAGSAEATSGLPFVSNPNTDDSFPKDDPRFPATRLELLRKVADWVALNPSGSHPLQLLRLSKHVFFTLPGEPTGMMAFRIEQTIRETLKDAQGAAPDGAICVLGYAGDYAGYLTTDEEYRCQSYEAASALYGRNEARHLRALYQGLCDGRLKDSEPGVIGHPQSAPNPAAPFLKAGPVRQRSPSHVSLTQRGQHLRLSFRLPAHTPLGLAEDGPLFYLRCAGHTLLEQGLPLDDADQLWELQVHTKRFLGIALHDLWTVAFDFEPQEGVELLLPERRFITGFTRPLP